MVTDAKRPVTPQDLGAFQPVSDPQISPDGSAVAFVVTRADLRENRNRSSLWLVPVAPHLTQRRLTNPERGSDRAPRWSPDGSQLAFISDRSGRPQVWIIDATGGEARCVETTERPAGPPVWSPDGSCIAFAAAVFDKPAGWEPYPGAPPGDRMRAGAAAAFEPGIGAPEPNLTKVITRLKFRLDGVGYAGDRRSHIFVVPADGSELARQVTSGEFDHAFPAWSPDGRALYCSALRRDDADLLFRSDIWRFPLAGGEPACICENGGPMVDIQVSPDGRFLAFGGHDGRSGLSTSSHLLLLPLTGDGGAAGPARNLTEGLDRNVGVSGTSDVRPTRPATAGRWAAGSTGLYMLVADRGNAHLFYAPVDGAPPRRLTAGADRAVCDFSVAKNGDIAATIGDETSPDDIWLLDGGTGRRLTDQNPVARELDLVRPERFRYAGAGGQPVEGWVVRPRGGAPRGGASEGREPGGGPFPTVVCIHGGPHAAYGSHLMLQFQMLAAAGIAVLYTNPRGSQTYGQAFASAVVQDMGGQDFEDIMAGVDAAVAAGIADPDRLGITGWSYGGYLTAWAVTRTSRFKAALAGAPITDMYAFSGTEDLTGLMGWMSGLLPWADRAEQLLARSPVRHADRVTTPLMLVAGESDLRCPPSQSDELFTALKRLGRVPVVYIRYPGEGHKLNKPQHLLDYYERMLAWFKHYLRA